MKNAVLLLLLDTFFFTNWLIVGYNNIYKLQVLIYLQHFKIIFHLYYVVMAMICVFVPICSCSHTMQPQFPLFLITLCCTLIPLILLTPPAMGRINVLSSNCK